MAKAPKLPKSVSTLDNDEAIRRKIPTTKYLEEMNAAPPVTYARARPLAKGARRERDEDRDVTAGFVAYVPRPGDEAYLRLSVNKVVENIYRPGEMQLALELGRSLAAQA